MDVLRIKMNAAQEMDAVEEAVNGALKGIWTSLPAIISQDSNGHIATASSAVNLAITMLDGTVKMIAFPPLDTSPVHFPNGGGVSHTHPVKKGDEGIVQFLSRAQDLWHQKGGIQDPIDNRTHHLADSRWLPGGRSDPRKLNPPPSTTSQQNRSDNGNHVSDVHPSNGITHSSTVKHLVIVGSGGGGVSSGGATGGSGAAGTIHLPSGNIIKNAAKVLINTIQQSPLPSPGMTFANRKLVATKPIPPPMSGSSQISSIMSTVMSVGISSLLSSPTAAATSSLTSAITSAASSLTSTLGGAGAGLVSALTGSGGLSAAVGALETGVSALSGATTPTGGAYGLTDVVAQAQNITQYFGIDPPTPVSLSAVLAPLQSASTLAAIEAQVTGLTAGVLSTETSQAVAMAAFTAMTAQINALMTNANSAIATLQAALPALQLAALAGSMGVSLDPNELAVAATLAGPQIAALIAAMAAEIEPTADDIVAIQSFPDADADSAGATGGL
jgi:hypothetical protein